MYLIPFALLFGFLNCARGRKLFGTTSSTEVGRLVSTFLMSCAIAALLPYNWKLMIEVGAISWALLMLWATPAWDAYWSAEIGHDPIHSRLWGLGMMTLRMSLAMPLLGVLAFIVNEPTHNFYILGLLLMGTPYYITGWFKGFEKWAIATSEFADGAILGTLVFLTIGG